MTEWKHFPGAASVAQVIGDATETKVSVAEKVGPCGCCRGVAITLIAINAKGVGIGTGLTLDTNSAIELAAAIYEAPQASALGKAVHNG